MKRIISLTFYLCIFAGGIVVAVLSDDSIVMWIGIAISVLPPLSSILTFRDIVELQEKQKKTIYVGETIGYVPDIATCAIEEQFKKDYPELNQ